ncbi:hypothetical protein MLD52_10895 [Puniceicoccaceae bacterium K14]|nr:hypothetical protein [Puniceicoccaceae bacterium K14]
MVGVREADWIAYNEDLDALIVTLRGDMTAERFIPIFYRTLEHPEFHKGIHMIWDATRAHIFRMPLSEFKEITEHVKKTSSLRGKCNSAWLFRNLEDYRLACMVNVLFGSLVPINYEVFQSLVEAEDWLRTLNKTTRYRELT